jgi:hypothetical protein
VQAGQEQQHFLGTGPTAQPGKNPTERAPSLSNRAVPPATNANSEDRSDGAKSADSEATNDRTAFWDIVLAKSTLLIMLANVVLAYFAGSGLKATRKGLKLTEEGLVFTKKAFDDASASSKQALEATHRTERAYFDMQSFLPRTVDLLDDIQVFKLKNTGSTPALKVETRAWLCGILLPLAPNFDRTAFQGRAIVPGGGIITHTLRESTFEVADGSHLLFEVTYKDVFGLPHTYRCLVLVRQRPGSFPMYIAESEPEGCNGAYDYAD